MEGSHEGNPFCAEPERPAGGALAEGFQDRLREFQQFERAFEVRRFWFRSGYTGASVLQGCVSVTRCGSDPVPPDLCLQEFISRSAVRTKFEQHTARARQITEAVRAVMDAINIASADRKICCLEEREEQRDRLDFVRGQMSRLSDSVRDRIRTLTHDVAAKKLVQHVEERIVGCLAHRCSVGVLRDMQEAQRHMTGTDPTRFWFSDAQTQLSAPSSSFQMTYDLTLPALCADFRENIDFRFSLGWTALVARFLGVTSAKRALGGGERGLQVSSPQEGGASDVARPAFRSEVMASIATGLVSATSRASMALLLIGGVVWRSVGWRVIALSVSLYGLLYLYERLTWTDASKERALKQQFMDHAAHRLRAVVPVTSSACSQQVYKELTATFSRLTQRVDLSEAELEGSIRLLTFRIQNLEKIQRRSKAFR
uniref:Fzo/mitofusin HR2 domain-containing protein n=1 Tax=Fundulus heteroclitus TaxID=8078 RepID=A0A3Q2PFA9_FUNHE